MSAINTSISYQSQFASPNSSSNDMRTKSGAQSEVEIKTGLDLKAVSPEYSVKSAPQVGEPGRLVNLRA